MGEGADYIGKYKMGSIEWGTNDEEYTMRTRLYKSVKDGIGFGNRGSFVERVGSCPTYKELVKICVCVAY
jgi:hypothetical protein